jgi:uncharacterized protein with NAD-binding domain and iron-sulfur cluster
MAQKVPIRVAVVGGGCAAMAAAFELSRPEHDGRFEITVYQMGWRLGGKGASGRGRHDRIEEHGLHLWMGFYENAFRLMRECYAELGRDADRCRIADWRDAFVPAEVNVVADLSAGGRWKPWKVLFPPMPGLPGDPPTESERWTVATYLGRCVSLLRTLIESLPAVALGGDGADAAPASAASLADRIAQLLRYGELATLAAVIEALRLLEGALGATPIATEGALTRLVASITDAARRQIEALIDLDDEARRLWEIADLVLALLRGAIRFGLLTDPRGFDAINDYDCREWLLLNGASQRSVSSAFVRALYDLAFAYEDGDVSRPRIAAGQALRGAVRAFFTYRGAFFWKMRAGMGDVVFAPFYEVLRKRGVRFEFFHRLENLRLGPAKVGETPYVAAVELDVQATPRAGEYRPLVDVRGLPCWPAEPLYDQLVEGRTVERERWDFECPWDRRRVASKTLEVGRDFDFVVLGVGVGAVPSVARELVERDVRWRAMVQKVKSVPTQAFQVWLSDDMAKLGWPHGAANLSGFVEPFDTWADMSHLIAEESFPRSPKTIAYFCSVLADAPAEPDLGQARARDDEVRRNAIAFLNDHAREIWPAAEQPGGGFRWDLLTDGERPTARSPAGERRFDAQFWHANVNPSDRYVLALPGTLRYRISPLDRTFDNLTIAGDWTDCGFNEGCVEAAVMSGRLAAHALSQSPPLGDIVGYDHP